MADKIFIDGDAHDYVSPPITWEPKNHDDPGHDASIGKIMRWGGIFVAEISDDVPEDQRKATARRLAACYNACEGLPTEFLEQLVSLKEYFEAAKRLREQEDNADEEHY